MGPLTEPMRARRLAAQGDLKYPITWTTLHEGMLDLEKHGVSANFASSIGAATLREYAVGLEDKRATPEQLQTMRDLVEREMKDGALGVASALIYAPGFYANTEELIEISQSRRPKHKGIYISHMRSEGNRLIEAVEELIRISREAGLPGGDLPPEGRGRLELLEDGPRHRARGSGARERPSDHGGHVHVHGRRHGTRRRDAAMGRGRRHGRALQAAERSGSAREDREGDSDADRGVGEPVSREPDRRIACCWWSSSRRRSSR